MAYKPFTEITNWAQSEGFTTEHVIRYFWWDYAVYLSDLHVDKIYSELLEGNGKLGIPWSGMREHINNAFAGQDPKEYLNEPWKDSFREFVKTYCMEEETL